jgi:hypothetical protein
VKFYLNAGFGQPLGSDLGLIRRFGFEGVRQDLPPGKELALIREFAPGQPGGELRPLFLVNGGKMLEDPEAAGGRATQVALMMYELGVKGEIEIGNEPNIAREPYRSNPRLLATSIQVAWDVMQRDRRIRDTRLVIGGIMNTDEGGLAYLEALLSTGVPGPVIIGFHTYRTTTTPHKPSKGFSSRSAEFHRLQALAGGRRLWNTEIGWHTAPSKVGCWPFTKKVQWSDAEVYDHLMDEASYNEAAGVEVMTIFQLNDGPGNGYEDRFGIRDYGGWLKDSSEVPRQWKEVVDVLRPGDTR